MANNILFFTALKANDPNMMAYQEWSLKTWNYYCKKYDCKLIVLQDPLYDTEWMRPTWQRWHVYEILEHNNIEYDQIALIDIDTMVRWDAPNIFEVSEGRYTGVIDDLSIEWLYNSIVGYKEYFPNIDLQWDKYINNGMLVLPKEGGKEFCKKVIDFYLANVDSLRDKQHVSLKKGTDQTPINYLALETFGNDINYISKKFNMTHMYKTHAFVEDIFIKCSYVWHFNGLPREQRNTYMKYTWEKIQHHYAN